MPNVPKKLTLVAIENYHEIITEYIKDNEILISEYDDMTECVLKMIREGYCFNMDKNLLRGFLEDLTYMYSPNDEKNKDRIVNMLEESDEEDSDDESGGDEGEQMNKMMQMLMGGGPPPKMSGDPSPQMSGSSQPVEVGEVGEVGEVSEGSEEVSKCCEGTDEKCKGQDGECCKDTVDESK